MWVLMNSRAPISGLDSPSLASRATWASWAVSSWLAGCGGRPGGALAGGFPAGRELPPGPFGESFHPDLVQHLECGAQLFPGVGAAVYAAQPFAVEQMGAGQLGAELGAAQPVDRLGVPALGGLALGHQRA